MHTEATSSFLWFAAIQGIKGKYNLPGLAPKCCFIAAETIERKVREIGKTQKATRELDGRIDSRSDGFRLGSWQGFFLRRDVVRCRIAIVTDRASRPEHRIDDFSRSREDAAGLSEFTQMVSLNFE